MFKWIFIFQEHFSFHTSLCLCFVVSLCSTWRYFSDNFRVADALHCFEYVHYSKVFTFITLESQDISQQFPYLIKGTGFAIVIVNIICTVYYAVILSYPLIYVYRSFSLKLPWTDCNNAWNTPNCTRVGRLIFIIFQNFLTRIWFDF